MNIPGVIPEVWYINESDYYSGGILLRQRYGRESRVKNTLFDRIVKLLELESVKRME